MVGQLTLDERRRIFIARQQTCDDIIMRRSAPTSAPETQRPGLCLNRFVKTVAIAVLLSVGWFACHAVELHIPASIAEAFPRL
jgi:hypothetical protein